MDNDMNESLYGDVIPQEDSAGSAAEETAAENDGQAEGAPSGAAEEGTGNTPQKDTQKPEQSLQERARQAEGRRLREREQQGFNAGYSRARAEMDELLKKIGIENPATGGTVNSVDALADYYKGMRDQRMAAGQGTAQDMKDVVLEAIQEERAKNAPTSGSGEVERQIAEMVMEGSEPQNDNETQIYENMKARTAYFEKFGSKENYVLVNTAFWGYAFVSENGWIELEDDMDQFEWVKNFYIRFIEPLPDDTLLTIYECNK